MQCLMFRPYAPLASWGDIAVGEDRPSHEYPGRSAVLGLVAAALGIRRDEQARLDALSASLGLAVGVYSTGRLLRDYHTSQVPSAKDMKKRPHRTRADELALPRSELNTILSRRDYRQDALCTVLLWRRVADTEFSLAAIRDALLKPQFVLYLGRKSCPLAVPLQPQLVEADSLIAAFTAAEFPPIEGLRDADQLQRIAFDSDAALPLGDVEATRFSVTRRDEPRSRARWQFSDRTEQVALFGAATEHVEAQA
ncbi:MAG: type I-E CRISPR-associated protein Cas5/CasD [Aquimonas sp.]|nr:type I-E CRISPR-associated protein Cas5/CasD [Aquimonas sp.]